METKEKTCLMVKRQFDACRNFKQIIKLDKEITRCVNFENGLQWNMDDDIAEYPKITLNIIKQIGKTRMSNIMQNEYSYLVNSTNFKSARKIQDFLKNLAIKSKLRTKDLKALKEDFTKSMAIGYFYWDAEKRGFLSKSGGEMRYELIDIRNFGVANPSIQNIQDQEWVIYATREKLGAVIKKYGKKDGLVPDENVYTKDTEKEQNADELEENFLTVYTKFYRNEEGEVFFLICTENTLLKEPTALNPFYEANDSKEQPNTLSVHDEKLVKKRDKRSEHAWNLYPFARLCLNERDNCFYGMPIISEYIGSQKSINNHFSVYDKALQDNVLGGFLYREGAIDPDEITTENGQMIKVNAMPNENITNALSRIPVANVPSDSHNYSNNLIGMTREVAGASNVQIGKSDFSGQSGKQTQMLLERAKENSSDNAILFNEFKVEQAYIMFLFAKFYYDNEDFVVTDHGVNKDEVRKYSKDTELGVFDGTEYLEDDVMLDIKVGSAPSFSEFTNIELMGLALQSGQIPFEVYVHMLPDGYVSNKQELIEISKDNSNKKLLELQQVIEQQNKVMEQMVDAYNTAKERIKNVDTIIGENERLKSNMAEVMAKAISRVAKSDEEKTQMTDEMRKMIQLYSKK